MWRWLIATAFINEMRKENGTVSIIDDTGNPSEVAVYSNGIVAMPLYPVAERLAMANNIEGAMIERFGIESGTERAIIFYRAMMDVEQGALTPFGRETLAELHNSFIAELNENGMPAEPVTH
ncbi:putative prophage protein [Escherichia coli]|nr:putative prophage protein [Escherichia coli]